MTRKQVQDLATRVASVNEKRKLLREKEKRQLHLLDSPTKTQEVQRFIDHEIPFNIFSTFEV